MMASEIARLIIRIEENVNPDSEYYGKLVKWWEQGKKLWHYGIGLSNTHFLNIGTIEARQLQLLKRHDIIEQEQRDLDIRVISDIHSPFESDEIIERLKYSLRWLNDLPEDSPQKKLTGKAFAFLIFTDDQYWEHCEHEPVQNEIDFKKYLKQHSPQLKHNRLDFFKKGRTWVYIFLLISFICGLAIAIIIDSIPINSIINWLSWLPGSTSWLKDEQNQILSKRLLGGFVFLLAVFIIILTSNFIANFKWSGFQKKSFWDWLQLLIVPLILAFGAFYLNYASGERDNQLAEKQKQQEILKDYFSKMQTLIIEAKKLPKDRWKLPNDFPKGKLPEDFQPIAQALTLAVLDELDGQHRGKVITYLAESGFIKKDSLTINLNKANLQKLELKGVSLDFVIINNADMTQAKLTDVTFINSDLGFSNFSHANLDNVDFSSAILKNSNFYGAELKYIAISKNSKNSKDSSPDTDFLNACFSEKPNIKNPTDKEKEWLTLERIQDLKTIKIVHFLTTDRECKIPKEIPEKIPGKVTPMDKNTPG